ncbi:MAG: hypothetical protein CMJ18_02515 [Phycisphaeraceae bacterium]|nr:hypothetical protein [Phycisphaeraceae bacterium]
MSSKSAQQSDPGARPAWHGLDALEPRVLLDGNGVTVVDQGLPDLQIEIADSFKVQEP